MDRTAKSFSGRKRSMSSPILPTTGPRAASSQPPSVPVGPDATEAFARVIAADLRRPISVTRGAPPPEVLDQVQAAATINEQLRERGLEVRFPDGAHGRTAIELVDRSGRTLRTLTIAQALELAAGRPVG